MIVLIVIIGYLFVTKTNIRKEYNDFKKAKQEELDSIRSIIEKNKDNIKNLRQQRDSIEDLLNSKQGEIDTLVVKRKELEGDLKALRNKYSSFDRDSLVKIMISIYEKDTGNTVTNN